MESLWIMAQADAGQTPSRITSESVTGEQTSTMTVASDANAAAPKAPAQRAPGYYNMILLGLMFVVLYFVLFRGPRRKQQQHKQMVRSLKKNDRVRTIGGIIGTVVDIKDDEIILKVDESNNTKIRVATSAIGKNMSLDKV